VNNPTKVRLTILRGSIVEDTTIDVNVLGSTVSIGIVFGPDGQTFNPAAVLDIVRPIEDINPDELKLFLTSKSGSVEELEVEVIAAGRWVRIRTWIAHFSAVGDEENDEMNSEGDPNSEG
jgi:hypothetical protein